MFKSNSQPGLFIFEMELCKMQRDLLDNSQLFNLNDDPWEKTNLYTQPEYREKITFLSGKIYEWQKRTGDRVLLHDLSAMN